MTDRPVDPLFYEIPGYETPFLVPAEFTLRVAATFDKHSLRGKITIIPIAELSRPHRQVPEARASAASRSPS